MTKLPALDFHEIWLRSVGYIWHVFCDNMISTYLSLEFNVECFVIFCKKILKFYNHFFKKRKP